MMSRHFLISRGAPHSLRRWGPTPSALGSGLPLADASSFGRLRTTLSSVEGSHASRCRARVLAWPRALFVSVLVSVVLAGWLPAAALAQTAATLRITVVDPSGAVIVGASVTVGTTSRQTGGRGEAVFTPLDPGRYTIQVESPGFEPYDAREVRVRPGDNRRDVKLKIARLAETVNVGRDPRERASDPRGDAFATVLGQAEINELPDDPDEMERVLKEMAGLGASIRVNGFRGGKLPPKDQIAQIRFHRNMFAADAHEPGFMSVDIITKPGLETWRGSTSAGFRDDALNARNVFAPVKGDERHDRYGVSLNGPLWRKHTSLAFSADRIDAFDSKTIVAALPSGFLSDSIRKPNDALNLSARIEHALSKSQMLHAEFQRNHTVAGNLGVGDFDLPERGYNQRRDEQVFRLSAAGSLRKSLYNEFRFQWRSDDRRFDAVSQAPAVLVLNAFNSGGAQIDGTLDSHEVEIADNFDIAVGRHAIRTGVLFEAGRYRSDERRNATGTFTFASLGAFAAGQPTTFTQTLGDPRVEISQAQSGLYVQDDIRISKALMASAGVRQELQSHVGGLHIAPRGGVTWSPFKSGKTTVRAGAGIFYDWFDAQSHERAVQLDGTHQQIATILQPGYPDPARGGVAVALPPGRVQLAADLTQPELREAIVGVEQQLPGGARLNAMYIHRNGLHELRGVNVNAPFADGHRPDAAAGAVTRIESIARSSFNALSINVNWANPEKRIFLAANYFLSRSINESDGPFSLPADNFNLAAERGPAAGDARHRFMSLANFPLFRRLRAGTSVRMQSALPYTITTGRDDNGDTVSNDRPAGVTRNSARGRGQMDVGARVSWSAGFGPRAGTGPQGPQVRIVRGNDADPLSGMSVSGPNERRYSVECYAQAYNLLNHMNALNVSGVMTSPFFGQPTSAAAPRRAEIGVRLAF